MIMTMDIDTMPVLLFYYSSNDNDNDVTIEIPQYSSQPEMCHVIVNLIFSYYG